MTRNDQCSMSNDQYSWNGSVPGNAERSRCRTLGLTAVYENRWTALDCGMQYTKVKVRAAWPQVSVMRCSHWSFVP